VGRVSTKSVLRPGLLKKKEKRNTHNPGGDRRQKKGPKKKKRITGLEEDVYRRGVNQHVALRRGTQQKMGDHKKGKGKGSKP